MGNDIEHFLSKEFTPLSTVQTMVFIKPDIEAGTVHDHADAQVPVQVHHDEETDEEPDVEDIEVDCVENPSNCVNDNISKVLEVYDEETCLETMRGYYETAFDQALPDECRCSLSGCEYDYVSNTYRIQATLNAKTLDFATHYLVIKLDYAEGIPKLCSIR